MTGVHPLSSAPAASTIPTRNALAFIPNPRRQNPNGFVTIKLSGLAKVTVRKTPPRTFTKTRALIAAVGSLRAKISLSEHIRPVQRLFSAPLPPQPFTRYSFAERRLLDTLLRNAKNQGKNAARPRLFRRLAGHKRESKMM